MTKILKNTSLFIIALVLTFSFGLNVNAEETCEGLDYNECRSIQGGKVILASGVKEYRPLEKATKIQKYRDPSDTGNKQVEFDTIGLDLDHPDSDNDLMKKKFNRYKTIGGEELALFCLDAHLQGDEYLYAYRFLIDTDSDIETQTMDAAIFSVLFDKEGYASAGMSDAQYFSKLLAIRAIIYTFDDYVNPGASAPSHTRVYYAGGNITNEWNNDPEISGVLGQISGIINKPLGDNLPMAEGYAFITKSGNVIAEAKRLYTEALNNALTYANNADKDDKTKPEIEDSGDPTMDANGKVSKDVVHIVKFNSPTGKFKIDKGKDNTGIIFEENKEYAGLTSYISRVEISGGTTYEGEGSVKGILGKNIDVPANQEVTVRITVHFEGYDPSNSSSSNPLKCEEQPIRYKISGTYGAGAGVDGFSDYVGTIWWSKNSNSQKYVNAQQAGDDDGNGAGKRWESEHKLELIESCDGCAILEEACEEGDQDACAEYAEVCDAKCDAQIDEFVCCDENNKLITTGVDDHEVAMLGPGKTNLGDGTHKNTEAEDLKACFVTKIDAQAELNGGSNVGLKGVEDQKGNTYSSSELKDNKYCTISCKEDYVMTMPTAKFVNAGRYFTFKAEVEGEKICYTNTINRELYNKDVVEAQKEMIDAYSEYLKWKARDEATIESKTESDSASGSCPGEDDTCDASDSTEWTVYYVKSNYIHHSVPNPSQYYETGVVSSIQRDSTSTSDYYDDDGHTDGSCTSGCCSADCEAGKDGTREKLEANIKKGFEGAKARLKAAQLEYESVIEKYNDCSDWGSETKINYKPTIYYDYAEKDYMNMIGGKGTMISDLNSTSKDEWYCSSTVTPQGKETNKATITDQYYEQCSGSAGKSTTEINYMYCTIEKGCKEKPTTVSDARYKKVTSGIASTYKPDTLFFNVYPSGNIVTKEADNNVPLVNKLPVSLKTERDIYKYSIKMGELGEFYNNNKLVRYIGDGTTAIAKPIVDGVFSYDCSYIVNIRNKDWVCVFDDDDCDRGDCIADCIGPNCDDPCDGDNCVADCIGVGCIYDSSAGSSLLEKVVSLNNLFPNGTTSYNWDANKNPKAKKTITEIEDKKNSVYENEPILSVTLTPTSVGKIKDYNKTYEDSGAYSSDTVTCQAFGGYEQMACYSSFITSLLAGEFGNVVNNSSLIASDTYRHGTGYFTLWPEGVSEELMIGPAWK